jgi:diguanylate cyclase (GGDEF)-like protein
MYLGKRVLVVDDEESVRGLLREVLSIEHHEVTTAASAEEALELHRADPFPLVVTDIRLGGMTGIVLLHELRKLSPETQVIMMTSYASLDTAVLSMRAGAYDYLIKPFEDVDIVTLVVKRAIEKIRLIVENRVLVEQLKQSNSHLIEMNRTLQELAYRDGLTGLYNHRNFQESLTVEIERSKRYQKQFSLIFLDVDNFKQYNDRNGHVKGDSLLQALAGLITQHIRSADFAARYGGEEFVILLPETGLDGAIQYAEKLRTMIEMHPFDGREQLPTGRVTVSMGISVFPHDGVDATHLIHRADEALYAAKRTGKNKVCHEPGFVKAANGDG